MDQRSKSIRPAVRKAGKIYKGYRPTVSKAALCGATCLMQIADPNASHAFSEDCRLIQINCVPGPDGTVCTFSGEVFVSN